MSSPEKLLAQYDAHHARFIQFGEQMENLANEILNAKAVPFFSVTSQLKSRESVVRLVQRNAISSISQIPDLARLRIVTLFEKDVRSVANMLKREMHILAEKSQPPQSASDIAAGYPVLRLIVEFTAERVALPEYQRFQGLRAEVQIRSMLQQTWEDIESRAWPLVRERSGSAERRVFARLGYLMELADQELNRFIDGLADALAADLPAILPPPDSFSDTLHDTDTSPAAHALPEPDVPPSDRGVHPLSNAPSTSAISREALNRFIREHPLVNMLDQRLAACAGTDVDQQDDLSGEVLNHLSFFSLDSLASVERELRALEDRISLLGELMLAKEDANPDEMTIGRGFSLMYLCFAMAARGGEETLRHYFARFPFAPPDQHEELARDWAAWFRQGTEDMSPVAPIQTAIPTPAPPPAAPAVSHGAPPGYTRSGKLHGGSFVG
jgi:ppGpp synthetase/RelA/SpoT-type nucleotidyltranferase